MSAPGEADRGQKPWRRCSASGRARGSAGPCGPAYCAPQAGHAIQVSPALRRGRRPGACRPGRGYVAALAWPFALPCQAGPRRGGNCDGRARTGCVHREKLTGQGGWQGSQVLPAPTGGGKRTGAGDGTAPCVREVVRCSTFLYFSGGRDRTLTWDTHRNADLRC